MAGPRRTAREVDACDAALQRAGAAASPWFRAPAGIKTLFLRGVLARRGRVVLRQREAVAAGVVTEALQLALDAAARRHSNSCHLGA